MVEQALIAKVCNFDGACSLLWNMLHLFRITRRSLIYAGLNLIPNRNFQDFHARSY
jgi:hypothetical protein